MSSGNDSDGLGNNDVMMSTAAKTAAMSAAEKLTLPFPRIAKFSETVSKPDFYKGVGLRDGRMYEEEVPLAKVRRYYIQFVSLCTCCVLRS